MIHWGSGRSFCDPLLWILHVGYAWIPLGLLLRAMSGLWSLPVSLSTHALTVGAIGSMTLGMMARVALGHTGRPLTATRPVAAAFVLMTLAACFRILGPLFPQHYIAALTISSGLWTVAFGIYLFVFIPVLTAPRVDGKAG
jgi:uncharacterized protein involved in response to NO